MAGGKHARSLSGLGRAASACGCAVVPGQHGLAGIPPATLAGATKQSDQFAPLCLLDPIKVE
jgi:hypothetical protein